MAVPSEREIWKPLLEVIDQAGGELRPGDAVNRLAGKFGLSQADLRSQTESGVLRFQNRVMWARLRLVHSDCLTRKRRGIFRLTDFGRKVARGETPIPWAKEGRSLLRKATPKAMPANQSKTEEVGPVEELGRFINFDPYDNKRLPEKPGVYVFYDISDRPIYVGEAQNIAHRIRQHHERFWFKPPIVQMASFVQIADVKLRKQIEAILIKFLKRNAVLNKQHVERS